MIQKLSKDANPDVRTAIAKNESTSEEILRKLAVDENIFVKWSAANRLEGEETLKTRRRRQVNRN
jgi:hypothetical protein